ncbi:hypothetical protein GJAV_G00108060 [Gymnothorax javanicus]|nr:hypothetical protein GJAV_G00108060 [Gymnothorax javanicus]
MERVELWFIFSVALTVATQVFGSGVFELDLQEFKNDRGLLANGNSCKPDCQTFFRVCLKNYQAVVSPGNCIFGTIVTPVLGSNSFSTTGGSSFSTLIRLPLNFAWPGSFSLIIEAWYSPSADRPVDTNNPDLLISSFCHPEKVGSRGRMVSGCSGLEGGGAKGEYCDEPICLEGCSQNNGNCTKPGECVCRDGWQGVFCDECKVYPKCKHATCMQPWQCTCKEGWGGLFCDQDLNYCTHHRPCQNGATCMNTGQGGYTCSCRPGYTGVDCQFSVRECDSNPCRNSGKCTELEGGYQCTCVEGFEGPHCEHSLLTCADTPCFHNGRCHERDEGRSYACECPRGYTGLNCERRVDKCTSLQCANGGVCAVHAGVPVCTCRAGFTGRRCEININECARQPCASGGTCEDGINDYHCLCPPGYTGRHCDSPTDPCASEPCQNGGICLFAAGDGHLPSCVCPPGLTGPQCEHHVATLTASSGNKPSDPFQWAAVALGVGLVALLVLLTMVILALRCRPKLGGRAEPDPEPKNNLSKAQEDNLIPPEQLKNTNKKVELEEDCGLDKPNHKHNYYHLESISSKDFKTQVLQEDRSHNYERTLEEKVSLNRMYREKPECRISTICSPWDSEYQSVFVIAEERNESAIATEV